MTSPYINVFHVLVIGPILIAIMIQNIKEKPINWILALIIIVVAFLMIFYHAKLAFVKFTGKIDN